MESFCQKFFFLFIIILSSQQMLKAFLFSFLVKDFKKKEILFLTKQFLQKKPFKLMKKKMSNIRIFHFVRTCQYSIFRNTYILKFPIDIFCLDQNYLSPNLKFHNRYCHSIELFLILIKEKGGVFLLWTLMDK